MNRTKIENQLLHEVQQLPIEKLQESLDFILFLKQRGIFKTVNKNNQIIENAKRKTNWRNNMSEKVKILVSEKELIQPMTEYLKNFDGSSSFVVLPIKEYEELIEDYNDLTIIAERRNDKKISLTKLKKKLNHNESV